LQRYETHSQSAFAEMVSLFARLNKTGTIGFGEFEAILDDRERGDGPGVGREKRRGFVDADRVSRHEQTLVTLFGDEREGIRQRKFSESGRSKVIKHSAFEARCPVFNCSHTTCGGSLRTGWPHCCSEAAQDAARETHVLAKLGHGADGAASGTDGIALFDGDRRRNAFDAVHLRLVHPVEELARVGREGLDVAPLAFGKRVSKASELLPDPLKPGSP
jgi:hypothetical protein